MRARCASCSRKRRSNIRWWSGGTWEPGNPVHAYNPLGKLPVLILDDGTHLYDSRVIAEYVDLVSPVSRLIPEPARQRIAVRKWEALADGVCDAAAAIVVEGRRPTELQSSEWIERQRARSARAWRNCRANSAMARGAMARATRSPISRAGARWVISICGRRFRLARCLSESRAARRKLAKRASFADTAPP